MSGMRLQAVTDSDSIRVETFRGRTYTVVPVVALVEGVIQGLNAASAEFAPADEFAKYPPTWNGRPVTLNHPRSNGALVSANSTDMLEEYQIGFLSNTSREGNKLKTEAWIDDELVAEKGDDAIQMMERIKSGDEFTEVSTGLFTEVQDSYGIHNNTSYKKAWAGVVPDHLAFLPDTIGACSVANGCGAPRLNAAGESVGGVVSTQPLNLGTPPEACCDQCAEGDSHMSTNANTSSTPATHATSDKKTTEEAATQETPTGEPVTEGESVEGQEAQVEEPKGPQMTVETVTMEDGVQTKTTVVGTPEEIAETLTTNAERAEALDRLVANAVPASMTLDNARDILQQAIRERWPDNRGDCYDCSYYSSYILGLTTEMVAFESRENGRYQTVAVNYSIDENGGVTFTGEPVPVNLIVSIVPRPAVTANEGVEAEGDEGTSGANQQQKESRMADNAGGTPAEQQDGTQVAGGETRANGAGDQPVSPRTLAQFLADAPDDVREILAESLEMRSNQRNQLITEIKANSNGLYTDEDLADKPMNELRKLNALAAPKKDYTGISTPSGPSQGINANAGSRDTAIPAPPRAFGRQIADTRAAQGNGSEASVA